MKKVLAIVAVIAIMIVMAVPALAAEGDSSVAADDLVIKIVSSSEKPSDADIGSGNELLGVYDAKLVHSKTGAEATADEVAAYIAAQGGSIVVDFSSVVSATPVKVLHKVDGSWKSETFSGAKVTVSSLSPFAFVVKAGSSGNGGEVSPQTGNDIVLWSITAAAMVVCAGYCFASARKRDAE